MRRRDAVLGLSLASVLYGCGGGSEPGADAPQDGGLTPPAAEVPSAVVLENRKAGTEDWRLVKPADKQRRQIEGYASAASVDVGESIDIHVSCAGARYDAEVYRLGWYGAAGGRLHERRTGLPGVRQDNGTVTEPGAMLLECDWPVSFSIDTAGYCSGIYVVKLTSSDGWQQYVTFILRDDARVSDVILQSGTSTFHAYNNWGGKSLYPSGSTDGLEAQKVSYKRPHADAFLSHGAGRIFDWDLKLVRFLEREGYDVRYEADVDCHLRPIVQAKCLLVAGHSEYWTPQMRSRVEAAVASGMHLFVAGGNTCYYRIRLEGSSIVCYKNAPDPVSDLATTTGRFRDLGNSEAKLVGTAYNGLVGHTVAADMVLAELPPWLVEGTGLRRGDKLLGVFGYESEAVTRDTPVGAIVWAESTFVQYGTSEHRRGHAVCFEIGHEVKSLVVNTGCTNWVYGLDSEGYLPAGPVESEEVKQITRNVLARMLKPG